MGELEAYAPGEVARHNIRKDVWISIHGKVYNVSSYLDDHPGGEEILLSVRGQDATGAFEDAGHSDDAYKMLEKLLVGVLPSYEKPAATVSYLPVTTENTASGTVVSSARRNRTKSIVFAILSVGLAAATAKLFWPFLGGANYDLQVRLSTNSWAQFSRPRNSGRFNFWTGTVAAAIIQGSLITFIGYRLKGSIQRHDEIGTYPTYIRPTAPIPVLEEKSSKRPLLDPKNVRKFPLVRREQVTHNVYRFVLQFPEPNMALNLAIGQHIRVAAQFEDKVIQRSYTPTSSQHNQGFLELTIKVYPEGRMGNYLLQLPLHTGVSIRGPFGSYKDYYAGKIERLGCIAGGTGITPIYQFIRAICENPQDSTMVYLLYANEVEDDILLRKEIDGFAKYFPSKLSVHYVLARPPQIWEGEVGWITKSMVEKRLPQPGAKTNYFICGPDGMVNAAKKILADIGCPIGTGPARDASQVFVF